MEQDDATAAEEAVTFTWSEEKVLQLIEVYRSKEILWNPQHENFYKKHFKEDAWMEIANLMETTQEKCYSKMISILSSYRREKAKEKKSKGTGKGASETYKSRWFAFDSLKFLDNRNKPRKRTNTIVSLFALATSIAFFIMESKQTLQLSAQSVHFAKTFGLNLNTTSVHIILSIAIIVALLWMLFSVLLVIGVTQNNPSFVLSYFSFGIIVTIICQLSALLVLLQNSWILALVLFICSMLHIHVLVVVHTVYELMLRGKDFRFRQREDDEDLLADCFDGDSSRI